MSTIVIGVLWWLWLVAVITVIRLVRRDLRDPAEDRRAVMATAAVFAAGLAVAMTGLVAASVVWL